MIDNMSNRQEQRQHSSEEPESFVETARRIRDEERDVLDALAD